MGAAECRGSALAQALERDLAEEEALVEASLLDGSEVERTFVGRLCLPHPCQHQARYGKSRFATSSTSSGGALECLLEDLERRPGSNMLRGAFRGTRPGLETSKGTSGALLEELQRRSPTEPVPNRGGPTSNASLCPHHDSSEL